MDHDDGPAWKEPRSWVSEAAQAIPAKAKPLPQAA